jgi:DNA primase
MWGRPDAASCAQLAQVENFIKTSGQTGMRLMVPLAAKYDGGP